MKIHELTENDQSHEASRRLDILDHWLTEVLGVMNYDADSLRPEIFTMSNTEFSTLLKQLSNPICGLMIGDFDKLEFAASWDILFRGSFFESVFVHGNNEHGSTKHLDTLEQVIDHYNKHARVQLQDHGLHLSMEDKVRLQGKADNALQTFIAYTSSKPGPKHYIMYYDDEVIIYGCFAQLRNLK